ncbi:MAG: DUF4147 domain-containing protein, partial [Terriglobales bacterium]
AAQPRGVPRQSTASARDQVAAWFHAALAELEPGALLAERLRGAPRLDGFAAIEVMALGKAAVPMLQSWTAAAAQRGAPAERVRLWLAAPRGVPRQLKQTRAAGFGPYRLRAFAAGHPEPNHASLQAGAAMLAAARELASGAAPGLLVALVSGGGSALAEAPLAGELEGGPGNPLHQLRRLNRLLIASGAPIGDINLIRKHRSAFKAGKLAAAGAGTGVEQESWILSDVAGEDLSAVASGPTLPDASSNAEYEDACRRWLPQEPVLAAPETPKPGAAAFARSRWQALASNRDLCAALAACARRAGCAPVVVDDAADEWEAGAAANYLAERWRRLRAAHVRPCLIAGGEVRVRLPEAHGRGGRNQWLALALALALEGEEFTFFSAGSDGVDGSSDAAGACVDGGTAARARAAGLDPVEHLRRCDPHRLLAATGDLVRTGPTGNNLRDVRVLL